MNERLKLIRTRNHLTQQEFADKLGVSRSNIANYENGNREPVDAMISLICRIFNVNDKWLRTGEGEMFKPVNRDDEIKAFMDEIMSQEDSDFRRRLVSVLAKLDTDGWKMLESMALQLAEEAKPKRRHIIKIAGRDGSFEERALTDEELEEYIRKADALPEVSENL